MAFWIRQFTVAYCFAYSCIFIKFWQFLTLLQKLSYLVDPSKSLSVERTILDLFRVFSMVIW